MMSLRLDPRTKLFLILLCVFCAMFAPNLYFQLALVGVIGGACRAQREMAVRHARICCIRTDLCVYCLEHGRDERHMADDVCGVSRFGT